MRGSRRAAALGLGLVIAGVPDAKAQWSTTHEQFYLQAPHNWTFRNRHQAADRLFNAFDYGHAILYETLWTQPNAPASVLELKEYDYLTKKVLVKPPRVPLEEGAIEIAYAKLVPEAKTMFEWAHILHRQIYDVLASDGLNEAEKDAEVARLLAYYKSRPSVAFSSQPKSMELMQEQPYSLAFRQKYPKFNGLIWGYHWLQVGLYEPLLVNTTPESRQAGVRATVARFWQMLDDPPLKMPHQMPMTAAVAPTFASRYPDAAIIFDNLHSMHDVISDILANADVPRDRKRSEILRAARLYRDDSSYVMPVQAWLTMSQVMGVQNMGGPAVDFLPDLPTPTVSYGAVMQHDPRTGRMTGMKVGEMTGAMAGMDHGVAADSASRDSTAAMDHSRMNMPAVEGTAQRGGHGAMAGMDSSRMAMMMDMHMRMMADTGMRRHILADTVLRRMLLEMMPAMPDADRERVEHMMRDTLQSRSPDTRPSPAHQRESKPVTRPPAKAAPKPDPHAGHKPPERPSASSAAKPPNPQSGHTPNSIEPKAPGVR